MLQRLIGVFTCQNATLLEITCHGSFYVELIWNSLQNFQLKCNATARARVRLNYWWSTCLFAILYTPSARLKRH